MEPFFRFIVKYIFKFFYKTKFVGFENIPSKGPVLLIANHVSYIDGILIQSACKRKVGFLIDQNIYQLPVVNYFMRLNGGIPILPKKESVSKALAEISKRLESGEIICIFPEGQLTYTGNIGRFKPGIEWIIEQDPVPIYPIAIDGLWGSVFSRKYLKAKFRWLPRGFRSKVILKCGEEIHPQNVRVDYLQRIMLGMLSSISYKDSHN